MPFVQPFAIEDPEGRKSEPTNQCRQTDGAKEFDDEMGEESPRVQRMMREEHRGVHQARGGQGGQPDHHDHRASHATFIALGLGDSFVDLASLRGVVIGDDVSQKRRLLPVIARWHRVVPFILVWFMAVAPGRSCGNGGHRSRASPPVKNGTAGGRSSRTASPSIGSAHDPGPQGGGWPARRP